MSSKEGTPGRAALALWSWLDAVGFENVANRGVRDVEAQVGLSTLDAVIAPARILLSHAQSQVHNLLSNAWSANGLPLV